MSRTLQTPSINKIQAFDPAFEMQIKFTYTDSQSVENRAVITNNLTSEIVYDEKQTTMRLYHLLPANILTPGNQYLIQIQVFDSDGNSSNLSDVVLIYCYSTPTFYLTNVDNEIKNSSITPSVVYSQTEGETIKNFQFILYDNTKTIVDSSPVYYSLENDSYSFYSMVNATTYYVRAIGETTHGMSLDTGYIEFVTNFIVIPANTIFTLENNYCGGYISVISNIKDVGYIKENCTIEDGVLTITDGFLEYNNGLAIDGDIYLRLLIKQIPFGTFLQTNNKIFTLSLINVCDKYYIELRSGNYVLYKNIDISYDEYLVEKEVTDLTLSYSSSISTSTWSDVSYADEITFSSGEISLVNPTTITLNSTSQRSLLIGKYIYAYKTGNYYRIPSDSVITYKTSTYTSSFVVDKAMQLSVSTTGNSAYTEGEQCFLTGSGNSMYIEILRKNMIYDIRLSEEDV